MRKLINYWALTYAMQQIIYILRVLRFKKKEENSGKFQQGPASVLCGLLSHTSRGAAISGPNVPLAAVLATSPNQVVLIKSRLPKTSKQDSHARLSSKTSIIDSHARFPSRLKG